MKVCGLYYKTPRYNAGLLLKSNLPALSVYCRSVLHKLLNAYSEIDSCGIALQKSKHFTMIIILASCAKSFYLKNKKEHFKKSPTVF